MVKKKESNVEENSSQEVIKTDIVSRFRKNPWMIASIVLGILLIVLVFSNYVANGNVVSGKVVGENLAQFLSESESGEVKFLDYKDEGNLYQISVEYQGESYDLYASKDGKYYLPYVIPMEKEVVTQTTQTQTTQTQSSYSEQDLVKISEFMQCLASKNVKVYGANWCGYTNQLVTNLGGYEVISPIYVECTENADLCASEGIQGYPTIKIDGAQVNIARTLQGFADATGCAVPVVSTVQSNSATASC